MSKSEKTQADIDELYLNFQDSEPEEWIQVVSSMNGIGIVGNTYTVLEELKKNWLKKSSDAPF